MPTHWKGIAFVAANIALIVPLCLLAGRYNSALSFVPLVAGWALVMSICKRHSPSR